MSKNSTSVFFKLFLFTLYWLCWVFSVACRLSLVAASGGCSLVTVLGLRIVVASLVVEHGLQRAWASVVVVHGLSCPVTCGIFLDQGLNPCPLPWQADSQHWTTRKSVFPFNVRELLAPQRRLYLHLNILQYSAFNLIDPLDLFKYLSYVSYLPETN